MSYWLLDICVRYWLAVCVKCWLTPSFWLAFRVSYWSRGWFVGCLYELLVEGLVRWLFV